MELIAQDDDDEDDESDDDGDDEDGDQRASQSLSSPALPQSPAAVFGSVSIISGAASSPFVQRSQTNKQTAAAFPLSEPPPLLLAPMGPPPPLAVMAGWGGETGTLCGADKRNYGRARQQGPRGTHSESPSPKTHTIGICVCLCVALSDGHMTAAVDSL